MTGPAAVALGLTALAAAADWLAVARSQRALEYVAKPAVMVGLIVVALTLRPGSTTERAFFVVALTLGLISDVFLMLPQDLFLPGLVAALVEHIAYIGGFRTRPFNSGLLIAGETVALIAVGLFLPRIYRSLKERQPALVWPVIFYVVVFVVMVGTAGGTGSLVALAGALLFFFSDAVLAWNRFVKPLPGGRLANIVPYHAGQALLVLSLLS